MTPNEERVFDMLVHAACDGLRCPTADEIGAGGRSVVRKLCRTGFIRSEIYEKNYRVIEILRGENAGRRTAEHPRGRKPYRIVDANGDRWVTPNAGGKRVVRHVNRRADTGRNGPAPVTLPRLKFLEGNKQDI